MKTILTGFLVIVGGQAVKTKIVLIPTTGEQKRREIFLGLVKAIGFLGMLLTLSILLNIVKGNTKTIEAYAEKGLSYGKNITSIIITFNNPVRITSVKKDFSNHEVPHFSLTIPYKNTINIGTEKKNSWKYKDEQIQIEIRNKNSGKLHAAFIQKDSAGKFNISLSDPNDYDRGMFTLTVVAKESFLYERSLTQDFTWGVVAVNTNKSVYTPGETAKLAFGVLNKNGDTICNAQIEITIGDPDKKEETLSTKKGTIHNSPECGNNFSSLPDYFTEYKTGKEGRYFMHVTATTTAGSHSITDFFDVKKEVPFSIERVDFPTRIYPPSGYPVELKITANEDYSGNVYDTVPQSFVVSEISDGGIAPIQNTDVQIKTPSEEIVEHDLNVFKKDIPKLSKLLWQDPSTLNSSNNHKPMPIVWGVDWKKGETYTLSYTVNFPNVSPEFYLLGPFIVGGNPYGQSDKPQDYSKAVVMNNETLEKDQGIKFFEVRQWQIASDATKCWKGTVNANWSTANNWVTTAGANATIASTDIAVFDSSTTTCSSNSTANASTIDATFGGNIQSLKILTYANTITQSRSLSITTATGYIQSAASSVFSGGSQDISLTTVANTAFTQSNGTFTATSGTMDLCTTWNVSGGTFNANGGTLNFGNCNSTISTSSETYNNVTFAGNGKTYSIGSGKTFRIGGTLNVNAINSSLNGPGDITVQGDITHDADNGLTGNALITVNGTGTQTWSGGSGGSLPSLKINKSSGTFVIKDSQGVATSWEVVQGSVDATTYSSEVIIGEGNTNTTLTGNTTFYDLYQGGNCPSTSIASGTTITIAHTWTMDDGCGNIISGPGTINAQGNITNAAAHGGTGDVAITLNGTNNQVITYTGTAGFPTGTITINKPSGTVSLANDIAFDGTGQDLILTSGTLDLAGHNLTVDDQFTIGASATFKLQGGETIPTINTLSSGSTVEYSGSGTYTTLPAGYTYSNLTISGSGTFSPPSSLTVTSNYSQSAGTFNAPSSITLAGNFARSGGSFVAGSGTLTLNDSGTTSVISGSTSFYNLTSTTPGKTINFTNGTTTTVTNTLTLRGSSEAILTLASTTPTSQWNLTVNGTANLSLLSVRDSNACGGSNSPLTATGSLNISNNSCWTITGYYTGWYNNSWTKRRTIIIDHTKVGGDLTDFPMLIKLASDSDLSTNALSTGNDILFTSGDGTTKIPHEIEKYNNSTGALEAWVKIPALSSTVNTTIYMYYGNAAASDQSDATNVWDSSYKGVWHFPNGTTLTAVDSTSNPNDGTITSVDATTGQIDGGALFNATSDKIDAGNNSSLRITGDLTLSAWVKAVNNPSGNDDGHIISQSHTGTDRGYILKSSKDLGPQNWAIQISGTGSDSIQRYSNTTRSLGTWYYVTGVYSASGQTLHMYVNGALDDSSLSGTVPASIHSSANNLQFGNDPNNPAPSMAFDGAIDEVHISSTARSAAWTLTEYNNQSSPSTFFSLSSAASERPLSSIRGGTKIIGGTKIHSN